MRHALQAPRSDPGAPAPWDDASVGSGWPVAAGLVLTNEHVVQGSREVLLIDVLGRRFEARVVLSNHADDLALLPLSEQAERIDRGELSPVELTEACLRRIERHDDSLKAFITVTADEALGAAGEAEAEIRAGGRRSALHGIPFEIVPGITAASGCASAAGIPLTHRGLATGVRFVTGHRCSDAELDLNWASLADPETTLVVYMGLANLATIRDRLIAAGLPAETPAAAIANGTTPDERICCCTLADLPNRAFAEALSPPVLLVIGRVVAMAEAWGSAAR